MVENKEEYESHIKDNMATLEIIELLEEYMETGERLIALKAKLDEKIEAQKQRRAANGN